VVFVTSGVDAPIREIAAGAGVGIGTTYRHFPTRADLVVAVYRHQVGACAEAGPALLASAGSPLAALRQWVGLFVDFLVTKHGLANALQSDSSGFDGLHAYFLDRLVPVCAQLLAPQSTLAKSGSIRTPTNWCGASTTSASAVTATRAMTPAAWSNCSSRDYSDRNHPDVRDLGGVDRGSSGEQVLRCLARPRRTSCGTTGSRSVAWRPPPLS
jgi:AcrR family transcriptional regulator